MSGVKLFKLYNGDSAVTLSVDSRTEGFYSRVCLQMLFQGITKRSRTLAVDESDRLHISHYRLVEILVGHKPSIIAVLTPSGFGKEVAALSR